MTTPSPPDIPLEQVLTEGLLEQIPLLGEDRARNVAEALAYDLRATGWVRPAGHPPDDTT